MIKIPQPKIKEIAQSLEADFKCFYNKKTQEIKDIIDFDKHPNADEDAWIDDINDIEENSDDYISFEPMESRGFFNVMEAFANEIDNVEFSSRLIWALSRKHPFRNFKDEIDYNGEYREQWFKFKTNKYIEFVEEQIKTFNDLEEFEKNQTNEKDSTY